MTSKSKALGTGLEVITTNRAKKRPGLRARRQPGSGAYKNLPNDVVIEYRQRGFYGGAAVRLLGECKRRTTRPSLTKLIEYLAGVEANAAKHDFDGALVVYGDKGSQRLYALLDLDLLLDLLSLSADSSTEEREEREGTS